MFSGSKVYTCLENNRATCSEKQQLHNKSDLLVCVTKMIYRVDWLIKIPTEFRVDTI